MRMYALVAINYWYELFSILLNLNSGVIIITEGQCYNVQPSTTSKNDIYFSAVLSYYKLPN